ncbi:hypothetical protein B0T25DRAFT_515547 [Lasiosphaeria hispida]|uniref:GST N-terminal domain-containing protein n=1 Tax=Lasiosphaeria hispida TaxID=260671 RepID=A0AAJ0HRL8_9PEZI|nr:hypothetical protein B0T25DRAFT_515547 [Lasiosphaeria hispida]
MSDLPPIVLYHYPYSPYARRVIWYLHLRNIPYVQCLQPPILPRPDLALLGIQYRRIPLLSIGRDIYLDTRLIIQKLETIPATAATGIRPPLSPPPGTPASLLTALLSDWTTGPAGLFTHAQALLPGSGLPLLQDKAFLRDRADWSNNPVTRAEAAALRPEAVLAVRQAVELLEGTVLADGRKWVLGGEGPGLGDIEAVWVVHWVVGLKGMVKEGEVEEARFPRVYAWVRRFQERMEALKRKVVAVGGEEARGVVAGSGRWEGEIGVDAGDPVVSFYGLKNGMRVKVWPTDSGSGHVDVGVLLGIDGTEVVWETGKGLRVHAPRQGFRVRPEVEEKASNL